MSEMVERVAAVIAAEIMELTVAQRRSFRFPDDANGDTLDRAFSAARLVFKAMREPTAGMVMVTVPDYDGTFYMEELWQAMIDEALK